MALRKTTKPGQFVDDRDGHTYEIYDVYPRVVTVTTKPDGFRLVARPGEQFILLGFACAGAPLEEEGSLLVEVNQIRAFVAPIRVLRDAHERLQKVPIGGLATAIQLSLEKLMHEYRQHGSDLPALEEVALGAAKALTAATTSWGEYVDSVKGPGIRQLITSDHDCQLFHRTDWTRDGEQVLTRDLDPIAIDVYMLVQRACNLG